MGIYNIQSVGVGRKLAEGLREFAEAGDVKRLSAYPCVDHSNYFANVSPSDDFTVMTARFSFKESGLGNALVRKAKVDTGALEKAVERLARAKFERVTKSKGRITGEGEAEDSELPMTLEYNEKEYTLVIGENSLSLQRVRDEAFLPSSLVNFASFLEKVFNVFLERTEEIDPYGLAGDEDQLVL